MGISMFGLQRSPTLSPQARAQWFYHSFAEGHFPFVGRIFEHPANGGTIPHRFARSCVLSSRFQTATNLPNRAAILSHPCADLANHTSLFPNHLKACFSLSVLFGDIAIPVGCP